MGFMLVLGRLVAAASADVKHRLHLAYSCACLLHFRMLILFHIGPTWEAFNFSGKMRFSSVKQGTVLGRKGECRWRCEPLYSGACWTAKQCHFKKICFGAYMT